MTGSANLAILSLLVFIIAGGLVVLAVNLRRRDRAGPGGVTRTIERQPLYLSLRTEY